MIEVSPCEILRTYFEDLGVVDLPGPTATWPCYTSHLPDDDKVPDNVVALYDEEPVKDGRHMDGGLVVLHYVVTLLVRASTYDVGWQKLNQLVGLLDVTVNEDVNVSSAIQYRLHNGTRKSGVNALGLEEGTKRRYVFDSRYALTLSLL